MTLAHLGLTRRGRPIGRFDRRPDQFGEHLPNALAKESRCRPAQHLFRSLVQEDEAPLCVIDDEAIADIVENVFEQIAVNRRRFAFRT
nr:hypothetical protein [Propionivibrio dicarboxylicus]